MRANQILGDGISEPETAMARRRVRWAASVYNRGVKELRGVTESILYFFLLLVNQYSKLSL